MQNFELKKLELRDEFLCFSVSCVMSDKQGAPTLPPLTGGGGNNGGSNGGAPQQTAVSLQQVFANVLNSANVQQYVLASPGLTQVNIIDTQFAFLQVLSHYKKQVDFNKIYL